MAGGSGLKHNIDWFEIGMLFLIAVVLIVIGSGCGKENLDPRFCEMIRNEIHRVSYTCRDLNECLQNNKEHLDNLRDLQEKNGCN